MAGDLKKTPLSHFQLTASFTRRTTIGSHFQGFHISVLGLSAAIINIKHIWFIVEMEVEYLCVFVAALSFGLGLQLVVIAICSDTFQQKYWAVLGFSCAVIGLIAILYGYAISRRMSRPPIGRFGRFAVDAISVCIALFLGEFVKDGYNLLTLLVTATLYPHSLAKVLHIAPDMDLVDMLLELFFAGYGL